MTTHDNNPVARAMDEIAEEQASTTSPEDNDAEGGGVSPKTLAERNQALLDDIIRRESSGTPVNTDMGVRQKAVVQWCGNGDCSAWADGQPCSCPKKATPTTMIASLDGRAEREQAVRSLHAYVSTTLADKRHRRDALEDEIKELVGEEYRLGRMVGMIDRAHKKEQEEGDDA